MNGPAALVANVPVGDDEATVATTGAAGRVATPATCAWSPIGGETVPAPIAVWLIHHENRAGQVSGAWERVPDTLMHVTSRGNGHMRIFWQKARWSSELHGTTMHLAWS